MACDLTPFVLESVSRLDEGERIGIGPYGSVYKVTVKGVTCAAKRLHDILVTEVLQQKFAKECALLSKLRHPNVVHFVGVHYGRGKNDLLLVMECLHTNLSSFLENSSSWIPLSIKLSILLDVSYGLLYFHTHTPPIIHRDLSANNVLLTTDLRAKIADLGVATLVDPQTQVALSQTKAPGSPCYMPPEALQEIPAYNCKLDIFSFGHLTLYVAGQKFPDVYDLNARDMYSTLRQSTVEIERRRRAIEQIGGERHTLYPLITHCLQDKPESRPTTTELNASLKELCAKYPHSVAEVSKLMVEADEELEQSRRDVTQLTTEVEQLRKEKADLLGEVEAHKITAQVFQEDFQQERKDREKAHSQVAEIEQRYQHQLQSLVEQLDRTTQDLERTKKDLARHKDTLSAAEALLPSHIDQLSERLSARDHEVNQYKKEVGALKQQLDIQRQQLAEKDELLQAAQDEQLQFRQQKDRIIQTLQGEKGMLRRQVSLLGEQLEKLQSRKAQQTHQSEFWEVSREEVSLNMQKMLGTGAWGFVVEGTFRGQQVAVKCMHDMIRSPRFVEVMRKEIGIMAQVRHPNLVLLIAAVMDTENDPLIVTELLDISLRKAYEKKRLQGSSRLSIFRDIAAALNYLHLHQSGEIIHRDVSSANVLLEAKPNNQWKAKLSDFGSAKLAIEAKSTAPGAPVYSAPEVRKEMGIPQTPKLDVYSYGILLCEVTEEQFPDEESLPSMIKAVQGKWAFMHRLISSCIQYHPDNRPTMSYVLGEFNKLRPQK